MIEDFKVQTISNNSCKYCNTNLNLNCALLNSAFKDPRFSGRPRALQKVMSALFASNSMGGPHEEKNGGIVFRYVLVNKQVLRKI